MLKQQVSCALLEKVGTGEAHFWQRRFYDFNVYSGKKITEKLKYMHFNPVSRSLVTHWKDWPWSSWSHYVSGGSVLIPIDRWGEPASGAEAPHP